MLRTYLIAVVVFFAVDMVWLGVVARNFYQEQIGFLLRPDVNWLAAIIFYLLFVFGLVVFVISPEMNGRSFRMLVGRAMLYGLVTYATYDLTNLATVKNWPILVTIVDLAWGMVLSVIVSVVTYKIGVK